MVRKALREIHFKRDGLGRIVQESIAQQHGLSAQTDYQYDGLGRITQLSDGENTQGFGYDKVGRLVQQRQYHLNANGMVESQALHYHYDKNGNRTKLTLPNKDEIHSLYYGSGHLSAIKYNDSLITEISRGKLHQELTRTQGKLTTQFKRDPLGRLAQQLAILEGSHTPLVQRSYEYPITVFDRDRNDEKWKEIKEMINPEFSPNISIENNGNNSGNSIISIGVSYPINEDEIQSNFPNYPISKIAITPININNHWDLMFQKKLQSKFFELAQKLGASGTKTIHLILAAQNSVSFNLGRCYDNRNLPEIIVYQYEKGNKIRYPWGIKMKTSGVQEAEIITASTH